MEGPLYQEHWKDEAGNPAGGVTFGNGFAISWQNGPLGRHADDCVPPLQGAAEGQGGQCAPGCTRRAPNGAFVEDVIRAAIGRLEFYQEGPFACEMNEAALTCLRAGSEALRRRTADRETRAVEGTHRE